jgi:exonuclease III
LEHLRMASINARSVKKNGDEIWQFVYEENLDIVMFQET